MTPYPKPDPRGLQEIVVFFDSPSPRYLVDDRDDMLAAGRSIDAVRVFAGYGFGQAGMILPDAILQTPWDLLALIQAGTP